jgi:hypothetical protein
LKEDSEAQDKDEEKSEEEDSLEDLDIDSLTKVIQNSDNIADINEDKKKSLELIQKEKELKMVEGTLDQKEELFNAIKQSHALMQNVKPNPQSLNIPLNRTFLRK